MKTCTWKEAMLIESLTVAEKRIVELTLMSYKSEEASYETLSTIREAIKKAVEL